MKWTQMKIGTRVFDRWYWWRIGAIVKVMKTRVDIYWSSGATQRYDRDHVQFLELAFKSSPRRRRC